MYVCDTFFGVLDPKNGKLLYINSGHDAVFVIGQNGVKEKLMSTGPAVGMFHRAKFIFKEIQLQPGEILFCLYRRCYRCMLTKWQSL